MKKSSYYDGGYRLVRDGVPCRVASWVKDLTPNGKNLLLKKATNPSVKADALAIRHPQTTYLPPASKAKKATP